MRPLLTGVVVFGPLLLVLVGDLIGVLDVRLIEDEGGALEETDGLVSPPLPIHFTLIDSTIALYPF